MCYREYKGVNSFLTGMAKELLQNAVERQVRGFVTFELPSPVIVKITNPLSRIVTIRERHWNYFLPFVESLWLASGRNDMQMVGSYLKKMYDFSDDNKTMRAGYGPRLRSFTGVADDYNVTSNKNNEIHNKTLVSVDQFDYILKSFHRDPFTRQAIITIADPAKDFFSSAHQLKVTKDFPCTTNIQFLRKGAKLDVMVHMRSNDFIWGASAVNIFNFTFMQEYFAQMLGLEIGEYYHIVNNLHYYSDFRDKVEELASLDNVEDSYYQYPIAFRNLDEFDSLIKKLEKYEFDVRTGQTEIQPDIGNEFFNDWGKVFLSYHKPASSIKFSNPVLDMVIQQRRNQKTNLINN